ncbi:MAG: hypothetical protein KF752_12435 [Pirellulaceae bacterium]|nr:hypothetical protein [Pirellulaceae bacterium]
MNRATSESSIAQLSYLVNSFWQWRKLWIGCTLAFAAAGVLYAILLKDTLWVASQGFIVRDEVTGTMMKLGRFESQSQMKASQETILEMAQSPQVVAHALSAVGRKSVCFGLWQSKKPYSAAEIESFARNCVKVRAPRGAELGTTEVIYLDVKHDSRDRAIELTKAICDSLEAQLQQVRRSRAESVLVELQAAMTVAENELSVATQKLQQIERDAGADLADLRGMTDSNVGSTYRLMLDLVRDDLRKCEFELQSHWQNIEASQAAIDHPEMLLHVADRLAATLPTFAKLRDGLAEAKTRTAQMQGKFANSHPEVATALNIERQFEQNLREQLAAAITALHGSIDLSKQRIGVLQSQEMELGRRLNRLADIRGRYTNIVSEVSARNHELQEINRELTQATAARDAASASSLLTRISEPSLGDRPVGPGRTTIVGGATLGGLFFGLGIAFMLIPLEGVVATVPQHTSPTSTSRKSQVSGDAGRELQNPGQTKSAVAVELAKALSSSKSTPEMLSGTPQSAKAPRPADEIASTSITPTAAASSSGFDQQRLSEVQAIIASALKCQSSAART